MGKRKRYDVLYNLWFLLGNNGYCACHNPCHARFERLKGRNKIKKHASVSAIAAVVVTIDFVHHRQRFGSIDFQNFWLIHTHSAYRADTVTFDVFSVLARAIY
jgi:hypothetical protein